MIAIDMPWHTIPLRSNDRHHWAVKAKLTKKARTDAYWAAMQLDGTITGPVVVTLIWQVRDRRVRDAGAAAPSLKAAIDGIVDAGLLRKDDSTVVTEERLRVEIGSTRGVRIEIRGVSE
jgi:hypothetical protein